MMEQCQSSDASSSQGTDPETRAPKRRRVSVSSNDSYIPPAPLPGLSRIKRCQNGEKGKASGIEDPIISSGALELGVQVTDSTFVSLNVAPWLVGSLSAMAIKRPTAIQRACIPEILKGRDCIGGSRTGSGKTVAFAVPILQKWAEDPFGIFAVVLTPTR
jgi:ATP-dependent RNA helicase DDX49/DBP8